MSRLILPNAWTSQPQYPAGQDNNGVNSSSTDLYSGAAYTYNASRSILVPIIPGGSGISVLPTPKGLALNTPNGGWATYGVNADWSGPNTVVALVKINSIDGPWGGLFSKNTSGVNIQFSVGRSNLTDNLYVAVSNAGASIISGSSITNITGQHHTLIFTHSGVASTPASFYVDGRYIGATGNLGTQNVGVGNLMLGCAENSSATYDSDTEWLFFQRFARILSAGEISAKSANVWASFSPQKRNIFVVVAGGSLTASADITQASNTSDSTALLALSADASITAGGDTAASTSMLSIVADSNQTQSGNTLAADGFVVIAADASATQAGDTTASVSALSISTSADITQIGNTLASIAALADTITANADITQAGNTATADGVISIAAGASVTQDGNTITFDSALVLAAIADMTQSGNTITSAISSNAWPGETYAFASPITCNYNFTSSITKNVSIASPI